MHVVSFVSYQDAILETPGYTLAVERVLLSFIKLLVNPIEAAESDKRLEKKWLMWSTARSYQLY